MQYRREVDLEQCSYGKSLQFLIFESKVQRLLTMFFQPQYLIRVTKNCFWWFLDVQGDEQKRNGESKHGDELSAKTNVDVTVCEEYSTNFWLISEEF